MGVVRIETVEEPVVEKVEAVIEEIITEYEDLEPEAIVDDIINTIEKTVDEEITDEDFKPSPQFGTIPEHKFKPVLKSIVDPVRKFDVEPVIEPVIEPFVEPFVEPVVEPVIKPYVHSHMRIPYYPQTPIAYGNRYSHNQSKVSKNNNFVDSVVQTV